MTAFAAQMREGRAGDPGVLVEQVRLVGGCAAVFGEGFPVADVVEGITEAVTRYRVVEAVFFHAAGHLTQIVI